MKNRDFRRLPFDRKFELTDGIYNYIIIKNLLAPNEFRKEESIMYTIKIKGGNSFTESFAVFECIRKQDEYPYYEYPVLTYSASVGRFGFNGDFYFPFTSNEKYEFKFVTEMDLEKYMQKQFSRETLLTECN